MIHILCHCVLRKSRILTDKVPHRTLCSRY